MMKSKTIGPKFLPPYSKIPQLDLVAGSKASLVLGSEEARGFGLSYYRLFPCNKLHCHCSAPL
jgi:hypothetical protein